MSHSLIIIKGENSGNKTELEGGAIVIGRGSSSQLNISDRHISRNHCQITVNTTQCTLIDLNSSNGTFVNYIPVKERILKSGDVIRIGETQFLYLNADNESNNDKQQLEILKTDPTIRNEEESASIDPDLINQWPHNLISEAETFPGIIGESAEMMDVHRLIIKVAPSNSNVLILGENGTGKELIARAVHHNSSRANKTFIPVNCAAVPEMLFESELFGHERGAFTGAIATKKGLFEMADGGTIFLDEIGELNPAIQAKLLRVLQEKTIQHVGSARTIKIDIRIIAATNRDLEKAIQSGAFREDLYYRLNVFPINAPPLRKRKGDILLLANYFAAKYSIECKRNIIGFTKPARALLLKYDWPGNVRELENAVERAVILASDLFIHPEHLPESLNELKHNMSSSENYHDALQNFKIELIIKTVKKSAGNYTKAAKLLELHPNYLHRLIRNLNIKDIL